MSEIDTTVWEDEPVYVRDAVFQPIDTPTAVDEVARRIRQAIVLGVLRDGDRLPAETELAKRIGVGVMTVRAALSELRADGLLETHRGRLGGSFVASSHMAFLSGTSPTNPETFRNKAQVLGGLEAHATLLAAALILWAFLPDHRLTGALLIAAALLNVVRLGRWAGIASWPEPLLFILHIGYGWVAVGTALLGLSIFNIGVPAASAIHALTAGATAVMVLAVMPRVTLGHTGRELTANRATVAVFVLINAAAVARVCASWHAEFMTILLLVAGACWIAAFGLFELVYGPMLLTRRPNRTGEAP